MSSISANVTDPRSCITLLMPSTGVGDWREHAACIGNTKLFFAPKAERPQARARREARANRYCAACPVHSECLQSARDNREYGFWAGESEEDRHLAGYTVAAPIGIRIRQQKELERSTRRVSS